MNALDAAEAVLGQAATPLTHKEITKAAIAQKLWASTGKTPWGTVGAQLYMDIKKLGSQSRFMQVGPTLFTLRNSGASTTSLYPVGKTCEQPSINGGQTGIALSLVDAAEHILKQFSHKQPIHYKQITELAIQQGLIIPNSQTPDASLSASVYNEIKQAAQRGTTCRFVKHDNGFIGLSAWLPSPLIQQIQQHNQSVRKALHQQLLAMNPADFETLIAQLLTAMGFQTTVTKLTNDGGIDVRGTLVVGNVITIGMAVQVKRWKGNIQAPIVQMVRGSLGAHEHGMVVTTSNFSLGAKQEAQKVNAVPIALMDGEQLLDLLVEYGIGVHRGPYDLLELGDA